ncbi:exported hypothetical protein [Candidatus Sulfotelmatobacter kueseliae]|uniref:Secreted protein n=1 Tax=Candidatus Sulfotelmatobacter kueseliae TaxID=2042962 RepID=A0A2U3KFI1_9BACT|nr:exported hypothetical protein [Candidatus Sulfotelmatobacter kueseliae]
MRELRHFLLLVFASAFVFTLVAHAQDDQAPSLGDVARQARLQKQQKDAQTQTKDAQTKDTTATDAQGKDDAQSKDAPGKDATSKDKDNKDTVAKYAPSPKTPHVITNEDIPEHIGPTRTMGQGPQNSGVTYDQPTYTEPKLPADYWKAQIMAQKNAIANLKSNIDTLSASIQYAGGNCVSNCVQWNERQKQKQEQVDAMKLQLEDLEKRLDDMQEAARKQGYGSSVYDP